MKVESYIHNALMQLGLSEGEASVYFAILQKKGIDAATLKKETSFSYSGIYKILNSLEEKGFVKAEKLGRTMTYLAVSLHDISKKLDLKGRKMSRMADRFKELNRLTNVSDDAEIYEDNHFTDFYLNIPYKVDDEFLLCIGSFTAVKSFLGIEVEKEFIHNRVKKGINCDALIFDDNAESRKIAGTSKSEKRETRFVSDCNYPLEFTYVFGDSTVTFYRDSEDNVKILRTNSPEVARARLLQSQVLWKSLS